MARNQFFFNYDLLRLLPYFDQIKTVKTKSNYGSSEKSGAVRCHLFYGLCDYRKLPGNENLFGSSRRPT
jgi:hypothetical protein